MIKKVLPAWICPACLPRLHTSATFLDADWLANCLNSNQLKMMVLFLRCHGIITILLHIWKMTAKTTWLRMNLSAIEASNTISRSISRLLNILSCKHNLNNSTRMGSRLQLLNLARKCLGHCPQKSSFNWFESISNFLYRWERRSTANFAIRALRALPRMQHGELAGQNERLGQSGEVDRWAIRQKFDDQKISRIAESAGQYKERLQLPSGWIHFGWTRPANFANNQFAPR